MSAEGSTISADSNFPVPTPDDPELRPGSASSLLRSLVGLYLRRLGGWIAVPGLIQLMEDLGVPASRTRTCLTRLKHTGLLLSDKRQVNGYRLNPQAVPMMQRCDRQIFQLRRMNEHDHWCLLSFSIPESQRSIRHQLRRRIHGIGFGMVSPALWIGPDYLSDEVERILFELDLQSQSTIFRTETPRVAGSLADLIETWWDLDALRRLHLTFQDNIRNLYPTPETSDRHAFVSYLRLIDSWRRIPYLDPGLPPSLLPADWPGQQSADEYLSLANQLSSRAWSHVQTVTANQ